MLLVEVSFFLLLCLSAVGQQGITVKSGEDATLQCHRPSHAVVTLLEWFRLEQKSDGYVFFYRNNRLYENYQHPSFRGRVELRDPEMKDRDVSVTLKNVTLNDTGTYKCRIISKTENGERTPPDEFSSIFSLTVTDSSPSAPRMFTEGNKDEGDKGEGDKDEGENGGGNEDGRKSQEPVVPWVFGTVVGLLLIIGIFIFISYKLMNKHTYVLQTCCSQDLKGSDRFTLECSHDLLEDSDQGGND